MALPLDTHTLLTQHMGHEEVFQAAVAASLKDTAVSLATLAIEARAHKEVTTEIRNGVERIDGRVDAHEKRIDNLERSVKQAANIAKFFFGGGFLLFVASAWAIIQIAPALKAALETIHRP